MRRPVYRALAIISRPGPGERAQQPFDLPTPKHALAAALRPRALIALEPLNRIGRDPSSAAREPHDALERRQRVGRGLRRAAPVPKCVQQLGNVIDSDPGDPAGAQRWEQITLDVVPVRLQGPRPPLTCGHLALKALEPQPRTVRNRRCGETGTSPIRTAEVS